MASRNPMTGDNWTKAQEVEFNKGVFADNEPALNKSAKFLASLALSIPVI
jgi:hypothetical protein